MGDCESVVYLDSNCDGSGEAVLKFRLTYEGEVPSAQSSPGAAKIAMRESFARQIQRVWSKTPFLENAISFSPNSPYSEVQTKGAGIAFHTKLPTLGSGGEPSIPLKDAIGSKNHCNGFKFVPLVCEDAGLRADLSILLLRTDGNFSPVTCGDLDNRVKTVIDALKIPTKANELSSYQDGDGSLFFVLLEDDILVEGLQVEMDELLDIPTEQSKNARWAKLVIDVKINISTVDGFNLQFLR